MNIWVSLTDGRVLDVHCVEHSLIVDLMDGRTCAKGGVIAVIVKSEWEGGQSFSARSLRSF